MNKFITRFYWLDILRGLAALSVVLWHWQHFFFDGPWSEMIGKIIDRSQYPAYKILRPFYGQGWRAVEFFFTLSGFIFFWLYATKIQQRKISFNSYLILRISRLFPLHILTIIVVIIEQYWLHLSGHPYFVFDDFLIKSFFLNLTLIANWFSTDITFNGPSWSISIEFLLYNIFFLFCIFRLGSWWQLVSLIILGWLIRGTNFDMIGTGLMSFFAGGIAFYIFVTLKQRLGYRDKLSFSFITLPVIILGAVLTRYVLKVELPLYFYELFLFPFIVVNVALAESSLGAGPGKYLSFLGDISYSIYLWHFPLQVAFIIGVNFSGLNRAFFYTPYALILFYTILLPLAMVSYYYFELPMQQLIRIRWNKTSNL